MSLRQYWLWMRLKFDILPLNDWHHRLRNLYCLFIFAVCFTFIKGIMFPALFESIKNASFHSPFHARCEAPDEGMKTEINNSTLMLDRTIGAANTASGDSCEYGSAKFYALCGFGGILSCGTTHTAIVPLDLVKCRIQTNPAKYKSIVHGFKVTIQEDSIRGLGKGWAPTFFGYSLQGLGKFGLYELFKNIYSTALGEELSYTWRTSLYLAASASAEFFADIALCPFEACKVRIQTQPGCSPYLRKVLPQILKDEGIGGLYKGLSPLWMRQIPYTMMKFACFERTVEAIYKYVVPKPRDQCSKGEQLIVTFAAGYIAGVFCAIVSHPADTVVSKLNQDKGSTAIEAAKKLGMKGLWKGLTARIIMIGTLTALQWFIYDAVKVALHIPRPPPPQMPESLKKKLADQQK